MVLSLFTSDDALDRGVRLPSTNVLYHAMWHNLSNVVDEATQLFLFLKILWVVPKTVVLQGLPVPLVVFPPFYVVCYMLIASSVWFEIRRCDAQGSKAEVTG